MLETTWDVVVIGAGAAGLMAALRAAERGRRTLLLEKNRKPGVKILMSGGTRCNVTHDTDNRGIVQAFGPSGKFLHSALAALSVQHTRAFFEECGVALKVEETGKIFPVSNRAADVLDALVRRLHQSGAQLALGEPVQALGKSDAGFTLTTAARTLLAHAVVITTGGVSYPGSGTTGDGYTFARQFGHTLVPPRPALVPLTTPEPWIAELRGITLPDVAVSLLHENKRVVSRRGSLLFAHFGLSGPVVLDVSRVVTEREADLASIVLEVDMWPDRNEQQVSEHLREESLLSGKKLLAQVLAPHLPRRLCDTLLDRAGLLRERKAAALSKEERGRLVQAIKHLRLRVTGTLGFKKAEVTAGGVALDEVDSRTMQSKRIPGLFFAGEVLDLDGPIGGFNFQAAWSTGWLAGSSA
jgi:predicted Rossmann fold flavoprotein